VGFAVVALLLMIIGPAAEKTGPTWNTQFRVAATGQPADAKLTATLFGIALTRPAEEISDGTFNLSAKRLFLSGPTRGVITSSAGSQPVVLYAADRWSMGRFVSLPFAALVITALFSFAYAESILRPIRRRRIRPRPGELIGLVGSGAVSGVAVVLATWVLGDRLPEVGTALAIAVCVCAAVGLLAFAWPPREPRDVR
jgi:hypothetical protein